MEDILLAVEHKCKNCAFFKTTNQTHGTCSAISFGFPYGDESFDNADIVISEDNNEDLFIKILISENFGCLKYQD